MMFKKIAWITVAVIAFAGMLGCGSKEKAETETQAKTEASTKTEPDYITVQHILIAFDGTLPGKEVHRTKEEAKELADKILARALAGEDFDALVQEYTDDTYPGRYKMANFRVPANVNMKLYPRSGMVPAFGDVGFSLEVGGIGMAEYDPARSKYGWHIIKRVE
jgi:parvulin-like peptidyl-prolyl isomerase